MPKDKFPHLLKKCLSALKEGDRERTNILSAFKATGLFPFDPQAVLKRLPQNILPVDENAWTSILSKALAEKRNTVVTPKRMKRVRVDPGNDITEVILSVPNDNSGEEIVDPNQLEEENEIEELEGATEEVASTSEPVSQLVDVEAGVILLLPK